MAKYCSIFIRYRIIDIFFFYRKVGLHYNLLCHGEAMIVNSYLL